MIDAERWRLEVDPPVLLPGREAAVRVTFTPERDLEARAVAASLRCVETYRYDTTETSRAADGSMHSRRVTHTNHHEIHRLDFALAGAVRLVAGQPETWRFSFEVPALGPATFEGTELRCDWTLEVKVDLPMRLDERLTRNLPVAQPTALLKAGVVATGQYGLFEEAPANVDAFPAQVRLEPVPVCLGEPFTGSFTVETPEPIEVQEVRLELRVRAEVTVSGGHEEEITVQRGRLEADPGKFGGAFASHRFSADAVEAWLPSVDLPHGRARATFHVILARSWAPDIHYVRDVALATTREI
jgi:hypothetical protein